MQTISPAEQMESARRYEVYSGADQFGVWLDNAEYAKLCKIHKCAALLTYDECKAAGRPVSRGERSIRVTGYTRKVYRRECPITGDTQQEIHRSPRTINLFAR